MVSSLLLQFEFVVGSKVSTMLARACLSQSIVSSTAVGHRWCRRQYRAVTPYQHDVFTEGMKTRRYRGQGDIGAFWV